VIIITGGHGRIGSAIAWHLAQAGHSILLPSHTEMPVESALAVSKWMAKTKSIYALICAHGLYGEASRVESSDPWLWREALEVNLLGTYNVCRFALSKMTRGGLIINLAGGGGMLDPLPFVSSYGCSKAGIVSLTKTLAAEHTELRVNCIFPGMQDSEIHDRLLAAGPDGNPAYENIVRMRKTGEGAIPIRNTLQLIDKLIADTSLTGKVMFARTMTWR
jgi:NAD(P)-dependent dehydrogenase (short-subunit alcohol dehydrogenase family)